MAHYFTKNDQLESKEKVVSYIINDKKYNMTTDIGVFSKDYLDFGTRVLLETIEVEKGSKILDVGCGYGPIGTFMGVENNCDVTMVDVNDRAVLLSQKNTQKYGIDAKVFESFAYEKVDGKYDHIITNPPIRAGKKVVHEIISGSYEKMAPNGALWVVIQKKQGAPSASALMQEIFGNCECVKKQKGYHILVSKKMDVD